MWGVVLFFGGTYGSRERGSIVGTYSLSRERERVSLEYLGCDFVSGYTGTQIHGRTVGNLFFRMVSFVQGSVFVAQAENKCADRMHR